MTAPAVYGGLYNDRLQTAAPTPCAAAKLALPTAMSFSNLAYTPDDGITISEDGIYEIHYAVRTIGAVAPDLTLAVQRNGAPLPGASAVGAPLHGELLIALSPGDVLNLSLVAPSAQAAEIGPYLVSGATLTLKKLSV